MKNVPIEYEYYKKKLNQRLKFVGQYSGFKEFGNKNSPCYAICFQDVYEKSTKKAFRDHAFIHVPSKVFNMVEENGLGAEYEFTAVVNKYKNKLTKNYYFITESYGLLNAKKITLLKREMKDEKNNF